VGRRGKLVELRVVISPNTDSLTRAQPLTQRSSTPDDPPVELSEAQRGLAGDALQDAIDNAFFQVGGGGLMIGGLMC
jgi:hypothetical protein